MEKSAYRKLFSNFIALGIIQGVNLLLPLLVMPYIISKIGTERFGTVAIAQVFMTFLTVIADYGFNLTATRDIALYKHDKKKLSKIFFSVMASKLLLTVALLLGILVIGFFTPVFGQYFKMYLFAFTCVAGQTLFVNWFFQGVEKMQFITAGTLIARLIFVILVVLFIQHREDDVLFLLFFGLGNIAAGLISIILAIRIFKLNLFRPSLEDIAHELKSGWQVLLSNLSINIYLYSNIFILGIFTNNLIVGYYSVAERIFFSVRQILSLYSQAIYPHICRLCHHEFQLLNSFLKKVFLPFFLLVFMGSTGMFIFAQQIVQIFIKDNTILPANLLRILSIVPVIVCLNIPAYQVLLAYDQKKSYFLILGLGTLINIIVNIVLVNRLGGYGTCLSIIITELFITIGLNYRLYKYKQARHLISYS